MTNIDEKDSEVSGELSEGEFTEVERLLLFDEADPPVEPGDDLARRRDINAAIAQADRLRAEAERRRSRRGPPRAAIWGLAGAAAAAAVWGALSILGSLGERPAPEGKRVAATARVTPPGLPGRAPAPQGAARAPAPPPVAAGTAIVADDGPLVLSARGGIGVRLESLSKAVIARADAEQLELILLSGELLASVDPEVEGPAFAIRTNRGRVAVTGTVFSVSASDEDVRVEVYRGSVRIEPPLREATSVPAGRGLGLSSGRGWKVPKGRQRESLELAVGLEPLGAEQTDALEIRSAGDRWGPEGAAGPGISGRRPAKATGEAPTAAALLERAQSARRSQDWNGAAEAYRFLLDSFPGSAEAPSAAVSLGIIQLERLGRPGEALGSFDLYLRRWRGGALAQEALWNKGRALRALGRSAQEASVLEEFAASYPGSIRAQEVEARLEALRAGERP